MNAWHKFEIKEINVNKLPPDLNDGMSYFYWLLFGLL